MGGVRPCGRIPPRVRAGTVTSRPALSFPARLRDVAPYALGFLLPPMQVWATEAGGAGAWLPLAALFAGVALLDTLAPPHPVAISRDETVALDRRLEFRWLTWAWVPVHIGLLLWALDTAQGLSGAEWLALAIGTGAIGGVIGITYAHELVHRASSWERGLGDVLLALVSYPHFGLTHVHGHHRHVATPHDPATARLGEGLYPFLVRSMLGGVREALAIEAARLSRAGRSPWHPSNRCWRYSATMVADYGAGAWLAGWNGVGFLALQSLMAVLLLETINYVEHYGLRRRELSPGRYEPVAAHHSWDSSHRVSNWLLMNLARHAEHHLVASRRYQALGTQRAAPQLPAGYGSMLLLATVPPLWRRVMDPRVAAWAADTDGEVA